MKRILSSLLILLMIITMVPIQSLAEGASLNITSQKTITGKSGESLRIPITLENTGIETAENISVMAEIDNPDYVYLSDSSYKHINYLDPEDSKRINFDVDIDDLAPKGSYKVNVTIKYNDDYLGPITTTDTIYVRVDSSPPKLNISRVDVLPNNIVNPGQTFNVGIELENLGEVLANNISVSLEGLSEGGFTLANGSKSQNIQSIPGGFKNYAVFQLRSANSMKAGNYQLKLNLKYNNTIEESLEFSINVEKGKNNNSNLIMENLTYPTNSIGQNKVVIVSFDLRNQGQTEANNIIIKATSTDMSGLVPKSISQLRIDSIAPESSENVVFEFLTTKNGETKNYPIEINVDYEDELISTDEKYNINQYIGVFAVAPDEDANQSTPKLIIDKYNFEPALVKAGENYTMNLSFYNTNSTKSVRNIKIFLTSDERTDTDSNSAGGSVFTPVDSSNTFYIDSIPPKGRVEKSITMFTVPDAAAKTYTLTANFEYEDNAANPFEATELIGVPVIQKSKLETGEIGYSPEAYIGQSTPISLEFFNTGKVTLYNMMVKIEGDFQTENGQLYIGNFTSGSSEYFEGYVIPNAPGELKGELVFSYEDSTGQEQEIRKDFNLNVMDMPMEPEFPGGMPPMEETPPTGGIGGLFKSIIFWAILAVSAVIASIVIIKKKKNKKLEAMEIDD